MSKLTTTHDVLRWLRSGVEWNDEASRDTAMEACDVLERLHLAIGHHSDRAVRELQYYPGEWGVWCIPAHPKTSRWPEHWWGQFWSTKDKVALGRATAFDEPGAKAEAVNQTKQDPDGAYRYEARPILSE